MDLPNLVSGCAIADSDSEEEKETIYFDSPEAFSIAWVKAVDDHAKEMSEQGPHHDPTEGTPSSAMGDPNTEQSTASSTTDKEPSQGLSSILDPNSTLKQPQDTGDEAGSETLAKASSDVESSAQSATNAEHASATSETSGPKFVFGSTSSKSFTAEDVANLFSNAPKPKGISPQPHPASAAAQGTVIFSGLAQSRSPHDVGSSATWLKPPSSPIPIAHPTLPAINTTLANEASSSAEPSATTSSPQSQPKSDEEGVPAPLRAKKSPTSALFFHDEKSLREGLLSAHRTISALEGEVYAVKFAYHAKQSELERANNRIKELEGRLTRIGWLAGHIGNACVVKGGDESSEGDKSDADKAREMRAALERLSLRWGRRMGSDGGEGGDQGGDNA